MKMVFNYNGSEIILNHKEWEEYLSEVRDYYDKYIQEHKDGGVYNVYKLGDNEGEPSGSVDEIEKEYQQFEEIINRLESDDKYINSLLSKIGVKKNGKFRKKAYTVLGTTSSATFPEIEFTPAWGMYVLRLQAISENEVEVYFKYEYL